VKKPADVAERFWKKVAKAGPDDCWLWTSAKISRGYGKFTIGKKTFAAHRLAFALINSLNPDIYVLHKCDVPLCCNPNHLYAGTNGDNQRDAWARGRQPSRRGAKHPCAKLTESDVAQIRLLYAETELFQRDLAKMYGINQANVSEIVNRKIWI
jgi:hypothetical protein